MLANLSFLKKHKINNIFILTFGLYNAKFLNILKVFSPEVFKLNKDYLIDLGLIIELKKDLICAFTMIFIKDIPQ